MRLHRVETLLHKPGQQYPELSMIPRPYILNPQTHNPKRQALNSEEQQQQQQQTLNPKLETRNPSPPKAENPKP